jgi:asparagine synthase (glutamine-hydrolysing)
MNLPGFARLRRLLTRARPSSIARRVKRSHLTYLSSEKLRNLERCLREVEVRQVPGIFVEAGVALGGSAILIATLMGPERRFRGYDVFGQIPPPSEKDDEKSRQRFAVIASGAAKGLGAATYYGYEKDLYEKVISHFADFGLAVDGERIRLEPGLFAETLVFEPGVQIALAHIDCDWYEPVRLCLERLYPISSPGAYFIIDDYNDYGGCRQAVDEFLARHDDVSKITSGSNLVFQRRPDVSGAPPPKVRA